MSTLRSRRPRSFLEETWRLHPNICSFTSELFYEGRLRSRSGLERQEIRSSSRVNGTGLRYLAIQHEGNQNSSPEEADEVKRLVDEILSSNAGWVDSAGKESAIGLEDILIIAPYNAQVFELQERLPGARIGTVDKFQGQEAPIVIYSMATSSHSDAPRGMEFLYSANRLKRHHARNASAFWLPVRGYSRWNAARPVRCNWRTRFVGILRWQLRSNFSAKISS